MKICSVLNCNNRAGTRGFCDKHYTRYRRHGDPNINKNHGLSNTAQYKIWRVMKQRCVNSNNKDYKWYGGKGIEVCKRWRDSYSNFLNDMGERPENTEIDRIDSTKNYEPNNCRWVTHKENIRNSSNTKMTVDKARQVKQMIKDQQSIKEIAIMFDVTKSCIQHIKKGRSWKDINI